MPQQYLTGTPFPMWTTATIDAAVTKQLTPDNKQAMEFYNGNHWQSGDGWGGPRPDPMTTDAPTITAYMVKIEGIFIASNAIEEVVDRHVAAVIGREPGWQFVPDSAPDGADEAPEVPQPGEATKPKKDPRITTIEAAITKWCQERNAHQFIKEATADMATTGHGLVRLFVPPGLLEAGQDGRLAIPAGLTLEEALDLVFIERVGPDKGGTATERGTMATAGFTAWNEDVIDSGVSQTKKRTELQYTQLATLGGKRKRETVLRQWLGTEQTGELVLDLDGNLLMHELRGSPIVTKPLMGLQKALNFTMTAMNNNNGMNGFMERIIANAQTPGKYEADGKGGLTFVPAKKYSAGPGDTTMLVGLPIHDDDGKVTGYTTPVPHFRDPSSPEAFTESMAEIRQAIYLEVKQGHIQAQGDGSISGASRIHMRADFGISLRDTRVACENAYRWLLTVLARLGALFTGQPTEYDGLRATVQCNVNTGPLSDAERAAIRDEFKEGLRSRESAMVLLEVDDPDAEFQRIVGELPSNPVSLDALASLAIPILPEQQAALMQRAGLVVTPEQLNELKAEHEANRQLKASAARARDRGQNPEDGGGDGNPAPTPTD